MNNFSKSIFGKRRNSRAILRLAKILYVDPSIVSLLTELVFNLVERGDISGEFSINRREFYGMLINSLPPELLRYGEEIPYDKIKLTLVLKDSDGNQFAMFTLGRHDKDSEFTPIIEVSAGEIPLQLLHMAMAGRLPNEVSQEIVELSFNSIKDSLHHEVRHYMQFIGTMAMEIRNGTNSDEIKGEEIFAKLKYGTQPMDTQFSDEHRKVEKNKMIPEEELMDSYFNSPEEFGPTIHTLVQQIWQAVGPKLAAMFIDSDNKSTFMNESLRFCSTVLRSLTGQEKFTDSLKKHNPKKRQKAIKMMYQELESMLGRYYDVMLDRSIGRPPLSNRGF